MKYWCCAAASRKELKKTTKMKTSYSLDLYNMALYEEVAYVLKAVQGGDDVPRLLIIHEESEDMDHSRPHDPED